MATDPYRALFASYVEALQAARQVALVWWGELLELERARGMDDASARRAVIARWPCGPTSHPRVLGVYRHYFLACQSLNLQHRPADAESRPVREDDWGSDHPTADTPPAGPVPPNVFAVDWLAGKHPDLQTLIAGLLLAPIGLGDDGYFC